MGIENGVPMTSKPIPEKEIPESGVFVDIDLATLIDKIVVTPYSDSWFIDVVKGLSDKYALPDDIVVESELKADPVYAKI